MSNLVAIDLGGTKIHLALFDSRGQRLHDRHLDTRAARGPVDIMEEVDAVLQQLLAENGLTKKNLQGVGVCIAGFYDRLSGIMRGSPNLPGWEMYPVKAEFERSMDCLVLVENDAAAAAYGEYLFGAGKGFEHLVHVTLGTGIGGGFILDGKLYHGTRGFAGEVGHIPLRPGGPLCGCGRRGCLETLASGKAIAREGIKLLKTGGSPVIQQLAREKGGLTAKLIFQAAAQNDPGAQKIISRAAFYLGKGLSVLVNLLNPQRITMGGGLARVQEAYFQEVEQHLHASAIVASAKTLKLVRGELVEDAGIYGMVALLQEELKDSAHTSDQL